MGAIMNDQRVPFHPVFFRSTVGLVQKIRDIGLRAKIDMRDDLKSLVVQMEPDAFALFTIGTFGDFVPETPNSRLLKPSDVQPRYRFNHQITIQPKVNKLPKLLDWIVDCAGATDLIIVQDAVIGERYVVGFVELDSDAVCRMVDHLVDSGITDLAEVTDRSGTLIYNVYGVNRER